MIKWVVGGSTDGLGGWMKGVIKEYGFEYIKIDIIIILIILVS